MSVSVIPQVIDALVALVKGVVDTNTVIVSEGYPLTLDTVDAVLIGVQDPKSDDQAMSASSQQRWVATGGRREEDGEITCAVLATEGGSDLQVARNRAFTILAAIENALRANVSLGIGTLVQAEYGVQLDYYSNQTPQGAEVTVIFHVHFQARI